MALDPSIILQGRPAQLPDVGQLVQLRNMGLAGQSAQLQLSAQQKAAAQQQTLSQLYAKNTKPDGTIDNQAMAADMASSGLGAQIPGFQKTNNDAAISTTQAQGEQLKVHKQKLDLVNGAISSLLAKPDLTHNDVINTISNLVDQKLISNDQGAQMVKTLPGPDQLRPFLVSKAIETMDASKRLETLLPKYNEQDRGGVINQGTVDTLTGQRTAGADVAKTPTPGEKLTDSRVRDVAASKGFTPDEGSLMAALAERGISLPAGMRSAAQQKATYASLISRNPGMTPDDIAEKVRTGKIDLTAETKRATVAAGQEGKNETAVNELGIFGDQVLEASKAVPRGNFIPITKLLQMKDSSISDPALLTLKSKLQTLNNAYDQLAARGGTDSDKRAHIAQLFSSATGPEGVEALVKALKEEGAGAKQAAHEASRAKPSGNTPAAGPGTGAALPSGATVSNW